MSSARGGLDLKLTLATNANNSYTEEQPSLMSTGVQRELFSAYTVDITLDVAALCATVVSMQHAVNVTLV